MVTVWSRKSAELVGFSKDETLENDSSWAGTVAF